MDAYQVSSINC